MTLDEIEDLNRHLQKCYQADYQFVSTLFHFVRFHCICMLFINNYYTRRAVLYHLQHSDSCIAGRTENSKLETNWEWEWNMVRIITSRKKRFYNTSAVV